MNPILQRLTQSPYLSRIRRNHGLEHATIHVLSARYPRSTLIGRADADGFYLYGEVPTEAVEAAAGEALRRLKAGEHHLAIHPNCGTNYLTAGFLAASASFLAFAGPREMDWKERLDRLPLAVVASMAALILAQPLGTAAQQHLTTQGDPGKMEIAAVQRIPSGRTLHRVLTRG